jgi:glycosyltransferase involved in cell wall biosynthesis
MFSLTENFDKLFSIDSHTFWPAIKDKFSAMCMKRFVVAIEKFELSKELFAKLKINHILTLYSAGQEEKIIVSVARKLQIPNINLQHGFYPQNKHFEHFLPLFYSVLGQGLTLALWSKKLENLWLRLGVKAEDILFVGSPRYDHYFLNRSSYKNDGTILLASNHIPQIDFAGTDTEVYVRFEQILREVCRISNNIQNKKLIVKLHPTQAYFDVVPIIRDVDSSIPIYQTQDIMDFIKKCDVLISVTWSTVILEAMILDKPTITFLPDQGFEDEEAIKSGATLLVKTPEEFEKALNSVLFDNEFRNNLIERGRKFVDEYMINQKNSSEVLANFMK